MNFSFWLYGLLAVFIAVALSSVELLTKHQSFSPREIFASGYYLGFASLNAIFCFLVYWVLPGLSESLLHTDLPLKIDEGLGRSLAAGLGYLVIARLSILDMTTRTGETYGAGIDGIYNGFAQYCLRRLNGRIREQTRNDFFQVYGDIPPEAFVQAARLLSRELEGAEKTKYDERLKLALAAPEEQVTERCLSLYLLIRNHTTSKAEAERVIRNLQASEGVP